MREVGAKRDRDRGERGMEREVSITGLCWLFLLYNKPS